MIFDHRPIEQITEDDLRRLIGQKEGEHVEFKVSYNLVGSDKNAINVEKYEVLKDVVSLANSGGGYIFIGVRDDGKGTAVRFESIDRELLQYKA